MLISLNLELETNDSSQWNLAVVRHVTTWLHDTTRSVSLSLFNLHMTCSFTTHNIQTRQRMNEDGANWPFVEFCQKLIFSSAGQVSSCPLYFVKNEMFWSLCIITMHFMLFRCGTHSKTANRCFQIRQENTGYYTTYNENSKQLTC